MESIALWVNMCLCVTTQFRLFARAAYSILKISVVFFYSRGWYFLAKLVFYAILFNKTEEKRRFLKVVQKK